MSKFEQLANDVAVNFNTTNGAEAAFDISMIPQIISIAKEVISLWKECNKTPEQLVSSTLNSPSLFEKVILRRTVRHNLGIRKFRKNGDKVIEALLQTGKGYSEADIQELYNEV